MDDKYKLLGNFEKILKFFDKHSLEILHFYLFLEKLSLKIEHSEIPSFFYNNFSISGGGTFPVFPPGGATEGHTCLCCLNYVYSFNLRHYAGGFCVSNIHIHLDLLRKGTMGTVYEKATLLLQEEVKQCLCIFLDKSSFCLQAFL